MNIKNKIIPLFLAAAVAQLAITKPAAADSMLDPHPGTYGYYVDAWQNNTSNNMTPSSNPAIGVLSEYLKLWTPGTAWNNGTIINSQILNSNIQKVIDITKSRTSIDAHQAYLDDRRNQNYSITDGLGRYTDLFRSGANAATTISDDIPTDALQKKYDDNATWADENSSLGNMVKLIDTMRNSSASTTPSKSFFQYPRPCRWKYHSD